MPLPMVRVGALLTSATLVLSINAGLAQSPTASVAAERAAFREWLIGSPNSPYAVQAHRRIGTGLVLGPTDAEILLEGIARHEVSERAGVVRLRGAGQERVLPRSRQVPLGGYRIEVAGSPGRSVLVVYRATPRDSKPPIWYDYDPGYDLTVRLTPPASPRTRRILAADGLEVEASDAGVVTVSLGGTTTELSVMRVPDPTGEESELEIYFRDETNGRGSYPAGRFVTLIPLGGDRYRLDLNRARNPFCAYSPVYACPLPWRGNLLPVAVEAGARYAGGGLELPAEPLP